MNNSIIHWQYLLTEHQAATLREIAQIPGVESQIIAFRISDRQRAEQGWSTVASEGVHLLSGGFCTRIWRGFRVITERKHDIHVFNGLWGDRSQFVCLLYACMRKRRVALISEPYSPIALGYLNEEHRLVSTARVQLRRVAYGFWCRLLAPRIFCVFAISRLACSQFEKNGFPPHKVFPYGYFVESYLPRSSGRNREGRPLRFAYVGALTRRKGYDIAIAGFAAARRSGLAVELDVYGFKGEAEVPKIDGVNYCGIIPFGRTTAVLEEYDGLVVPSRYDGWSVVVNEAIAGGVPVIASENVGAGCMIHAHGFGVVYDGTEGGLVAALGAIVAAPNVLDGYAAAARRFAPLIQPSVAARYVVDVLRSNILRVEAPPTCPWY